MTIRLIAQRPRNLLGKLHRNDQHQGAQITRQGVRCIFHASLHLTLGTVTGGLASSKTFHATDVRDFISRLFPFHVNTVMHFDQTGYHDGIS